MKLPKGFVFRKAGLRDIETIIELWQKCRIDEGTGKAKKGEVCCLISYKMPLIYTGESRQWFVKKDGVAVATGSVVKEGTSGEVCDVFVEKEWRGQGLGTAILEKLEEEAKRLGIKLLLLRVTLETEPYYLRRGWCRRSSPLQKTAAGDVATLYKEFAPQNK